ncbi:MAG TPA: GxxExxY protein [Candidatus Didemnitutus sp.]|jgi:GxxExxY protein
MNLQEIAEAAEQGMHPLFPRASVLTDQVIGAAIEVHRHMGPGLMESIYEWCLLREFDLRHLSSTSQRYVRIRYKDCVREVPLKFDILVDECILVEIKSVEGLLPVHKSQLLSYMKLLEIPIGLLINFHSPRLVDGISRLILQGADR